MAKHLAHLGRYQEIFLMRLGVMINEEAPNLERYRAENDPIFHEWCQLEVDTIRKKSLNYRSTIIRFINELSAEQLHRIGIHPKLGAMNVLDWTHFFILHESHIYSIFSLKQRFFTNTI